MTKKKNNQDIISMLTRRMYDESHLKHLHLFYQIEKSTLWILSFMTLIAGYIIPALIFLLLAFFFHTQMQKMNRELRKVLEKNIKELESLTEN